MISPLLWWPSIFWLWIRLQSPPHVGIFETDGFSTVANLPLRWRVPLEANDDVVAFKCNNLFPTQDCRLTKPFQVIALDADGMANHPFWSPRSIEAALQ